MAEQTGLNEKQIYIAQADVEKKPFGYKVNAQDIGRIADPQVAHEAGNRANIALKALAGSTRRIAPQVRQQFVRNLTGDEKLIQEANQAVQTERQLKQAKKELIYDELTGLINKKEYKKRLNAEMSKIKRKGGSLSIFMIDLDGFKKLNDTFGHNSGDDVLREFAKILRTNIRPYDVAARFGGDEFLILEVNGQENTAQLIKERILKNLNYLKTESPNPEWYENLHASIGVARYTKDEIVTAEQLIQRADKAMYRAKKILGTSICEWDPDIDKPLETI